jgi:hypothetical protein
MLHVEMTCANEILPSTNADDLDLVTTILTPGTETTPSHHPLRPAHHHIWHAHTHTHTRHTTHRTTEAASRTTTSHTTTEVSSHVVTHATTKVLVTSKVPTTSSHVSHATTATSVEAALHTAATSPHALTFFFHSVWVYLQNELADAVHIVIA